MTVATSGVCLIRVEAQSAGLLLTVVTDRHGDAHASTTQRFRDPDAAVAAVREFLGGFGPAEPWHRAR